MNEYNGSSYEGTSTEGKSSEQIKADIERTRSEMTEKIDTIQERLSPDNLKVQAQTMVQDIIQESTDAIVEFARTGSKQAGVTLLETIKQNPLPSAVIGVGLGWLAMNMMKSQGGSQMSSRGEYQGQYYGRGMSSGQMDYGSNYGSGYSADYTGSYSGGRGMGQGSMVGARVPYTGASLDEAYSGEYGYEKEWHNNPEVHPDNMFQRSESGGMGEKIGKVGETAKDVAGKVGETAQNIAGGVAGAVQSAAGAVTGAAGKVGDVAQGAVGAVGGAAQGAAGKVGGAAQDAGSMAGSAAGSAMHAGQQARHQAMQAGRMAAGQAGSLANQGQYQAGRMGRTVQRSLEDNPMAFGAAALLAGVAIALALPATRQERQLLGDVRDQVMDKAQTFATNIAEEAKQVANEVKPRLEETAQRVVDDIKMSGMQISEDLKQTSKDAGHEVKQTIKDAGKTVKNKVEKGTGGAQSAEDTQIVSGIMVEEDTASQMEPNVGGSYDSKFDAKS